MKRFDFLVLSRMVLGAALLLLASCATAAGEAKGAAPLKVRVNVPDAWGTLLDERTPEALVARVREVLYRRGLYRPVEPVRAMEDPDKLSHLLTIELTEWRIDREGEVACTFSANLRTPDGVRDLGSYTTTTMTWLPGTRRFGLSEVFTHRSEKALHKLCDDLAAMKLLPGLRAAATA